MITTSVVRALIKTPNNYHRATGRLKDYDTEYIERNKRTPYTHTHTHTQARTHKTVTHVHNIMHIPFFKPAARAQNIMYMPFFKPAKSFHDYLETKLEKKTTLRLVSCLEWGGGGGRGETGVVVLACCLEE